MPPSFLLVAGLLLMGLIGPVLAIGLGVASLVPVTRRWARPALRIGAAGAVAALAAVVLLDFVYPRGAPLRLHEVLMPAGAGFTLFVIAHAVRAYAAAGAGESV